MKSVMSGGGGYMNQAIGRTTSLMSQKIKHKLNGGTNSSVSHGGTDSVKNKLKIHELHKLKKKN